MKNSTKHLVVIATLLTLFALTLFALPRIPQPQSYHNLADKREYFNIPYFGDVITNLAFAICGLLSLFLVLQRPDPNSGIRNRRQLFTAILHSVNTVLVGAGSWYYHWHPKDPTLVWDRLFIALALAIIVCNIVSERISDRAGFVLLFPSLLFSIATVVYWRQYEDLRFYIFAQVFVPAVLVPMMWIMYEPTFTHSWLEVATMGTYVAAKICEMLDWPIYLLTLKTISGHSLKHLLGAVALLMYGYRFYTRKPLKAKNA